MAFAHFIKELDSGFPLPSYLLHSGDYYLLYEAFARIKDALGNDTFNFDVFDGDSADGRPPMAGIIDTLNTLPFAASRRVVIIRNLQKYPKSDFTKLEEYLNSPSETSLCVMLYEGKLVKSLEEMRPSKVKRIPLVIADREIIPFVIEKGRRAGVGLDPRTVEHLISFVGSDLGTLSAEVEKLAALGKSSLSADEIKTIAYSDLEYSAFDLAHALDRGDAPTAFSILENLTRSSEPYMVLGALNWHYKKVWAKGGLDPGSLSEIFGLLHSADASLKTSRQAVLEELLWEILQTTRMVAERPGRPVR